MYKYLFLVIMIVFTGCTTGFNEKLKRPDGSSVKEYTNVSKDAIFEAAKKVFLLESKREFRIDAYRDNLYVTRTKVNHLPFNAYSSEDRWNLYIKEEDNISKAKLSIKRVIDFDEKAQEVLPYTIHEIFWNRVDFLLGLEKQWFPCEKYYGNINFDYDDALCDYVDFVNAKKALEKDIVKDILIVNRKPSKSILDIDEDVLKDDIELVIEDAPTDILEKEDKIEGEETTEEIDTSLDKEIESLDKKVNDNIEQTLDKIDENLLLEDEKEDISIKQQ